jgi:hypothetical protein
MPDSSPEQETPKETATGDGAQTQEASKETSAKKLSEKKVDIVQFLSRSAKELQVQIILEKRSGDEDLVAEFYNHAYAVDTSTVRGKAILKGMREHPKFGNTFVEVGEAVGEDNLRAQTELHRQLRAIVDTAVTQRDGADKLLAFFTMGELREFGISPHTTDTDELIVLILRNKSLT